MIRAETLQWICVALPVHSATDASTVGFPSSRPALGLRMTPAWGFPRDSQVTNHKFILAVIGALALALFAISLASGAGEVNFINPNAFDESDPSALNDPYGALEEQKWARQGGLIGLVYEDASLDQPIRRVLIPYLDTTFAGVADIEAHSDTISIDKLSADTESLSVNDYVMIGEHSVRKVLSVTPSTNTVDDVTLDRPFYKSDLTQGVHKIKPEVASAPGVDWQNDYGLYASAVELSDIGLLMSGDVALRGGLTIYRGNNIVVDNDIAATHGVIAPGDDDIGRPAHRLTGRAGSGSNNRTDSDDALIVRVTETRGAGAPRPGEAGYYTGTVTDAVDHVRNERVEMRVSDATVQNPLSIVGPRNIGTNENPLFAEDKVYLAAWFEERNDTGSAVAVRSQAYQTDTTLVLRETLPDSGKFALKIRAVKHGTDNAEQTQLSMPVINAADEIPRLPVNPRDVVTASTADSIGTISVESSAPTFAGFSPSHNSYGRDDRPRVSAQVIDTESGIASENIHILFLIEEEGGTERGLVYTPSRSGDVDEISSGFQVSNRLPGADAPTGDATISWWLMATDNIGNVGFSDRATIVDGVPDTCAETSADIGDTPAARTRFIAALEGKGCDPYVVHVDRTAPKFLRAETGRHWDSALDTNRSADKTEYRVAKADKSSVLVVFDSHLDATSVSASDFEVNGSPPLSAMAYNVKVRDDVFTMIPDPDDATMMIEDEESGDGNSAIADDSARDVGEDRGYVFLPLRSDLEANATPEVELVGEVLDLAGNEQASGKDDAALDRIAPTLTVAADQGDRPVTNDMINLSIASDENIGAPSVTFRKVMSKTVEGKTTQTLGEANEGYVVVKFVSATEYRATIATNGDEGLYTVVVEATDSTGGNVGRAGDATEPSDDNPAPIQVGDDTDAILFERDDSVPNPDVDPDTDGVQNKFRTEDPNALIQIDFSAEANEYDDQKGTDPNDTTTFNKRVGDDLDTHAGVTILSAILDGVDISDSLQANEASNVFVYKASGLAIGDHKLEVVAEDAAGNRHSTPRDATITIEEREPFSLKLKPGWNLVSIPGDPADPDINAVIPADRADIATVLAYDPSAPGQWLRATRGADGAFEGSLKNIVSTRAYWIESSSFASLEVNIPKPQTGQARIKPTIRIDRGWNIVPILDVDGDFELSFPEDKNYFSSLTAGGVIIEIDTFNTIANRWERVAPEDVEIGKGYWVHASGAGVIVP